MYILSRTALAVTPRSSSAAAHNKHTRVHPLIRTCLCQNHGLSRTAKYWRAPACTATCKLAGGEDVQLVMTAHDSNNKPITRREMKFTVFWTYLNSTATVGCLCQSFDLPTATNICVHLCKASCMYAQRNQVPVAWNTASKYTATVPRKYMSRAGWYGTNKHRHCCLRDGLVHQRRRKKS